jgi:peptide chain release factor 2
LLSSKPLSTYWSVFDLPVKEKQLVDLQKKAENPDLWQDPESAQKLMKEMSTLKEEVVEWQNLRQSIADTLELAQLEDQALLPEIENETSKLENEVNKREFEAKLSGQYDRGDALLAIHAGAGGTDSQDWAEMLERMYLRWAEHKGYQTNILDLTAGEEAGIKSATIAINGRYAYGYLRSEKGVHRLVRLSPFDAAHRRHTSFAMIEVLPQVEEDSQVEINSDDLRIDVFRSSGAGGQKEQEEKISQLRGEYQKAEWGSQIRSYVLHPYQMVKDHRTDYERGNTQAVLDGDIDSFIEAYLQSKVGENQT